MPTRHEITITFAFLPWQRVKWSVRPDIYTIVWRRWHQGEVGEYVLYGLRLVDEAAVPTAQVYTAIEKDLRPA
jgi:hypothetical protein